MSERRDDTTQPVEPDAPASPEHTPQSYYYDDGTGYEIYDPATDEDETDGSDDAGEARHDEPARRRDCP